MSEAVSVEETDSERWRADFAEEWLNHVRRMRGAMMVAKGVLEDMELMASSVRGIDYAAFHGTRSADGSAIPDAIAAIERCRAIYSQKFAEFETERHDAVSRLSKLTCPLGFEVLSGLYVLGRSHAEVEDAVGKSRTTVERIKGKALAEAFDLMPGEWRPGPHPAFIDERPRTVHFERKNAI